MQVPFFVQATLKKIFPGFAGFYRRSRSHWHTPRTRYTDAPRRFAELVDQINDTPFDRVQKDEFRLALEHDTAKRAESASAFIEINNTCNIDCLMCMTSLTTREKGRMSADVLELAVQRAVAAGAREVELHTLGDPLANPRLADVFAVLRRHGVRTGLSTNGLLLHRHVDTLIEFVDVCSSISFSIDGATASTYEHIRAGGNWDRLITNLNIARDRLSPSGFRLRSSMVVSRDNVHEVGAYITLLRRYVTDPRLDVHLGVINSLSPDNTYFDATNLFANHTYQNLPCHMVSGRTPHTLIDGRVSVCSRDYDGSLVVGDIRHDTVADIMNGDSMRALQNAHATGDVSAYPMCATCFTIDSRVPAAINELTAYLLYFFPDEPAEFYQSRIDQCVSMFQQGADASVTAALFPTPTTGRSANN
jgi:pyruvate-formate lyase-activating enzyme